MSSSKLRPAAKALGKCFCFLQPDFNHGSDDKLGQAALTMENESVSMSFMQALYEVGITTLDKQQLLVATAALDKLST